MFEPLDRDKFADIIQGALDVIQGHKSVMLKLLLNVLPDEDGIPHLVMKDIPFLTDDWQILPDLTFKGEGKFRMLEASAEQVVLYYMIKAGSVFVKHTVDCAFSLHVCYGEVNCTVSGGARKKGETGEAEPNRLHQLCFPVDTGMIVTFDLTNCAEVEPTQNANT